MDLMHWHGVPSALAQPPDCCADKANREHRHLLDAAIHAERRRVVLGALDAVDGYWQAIATVLHPDALPAAEAVIKACRTRIQAAGCICPRIDVSGFGEAPGTRMVAGGDPQCGVHVARRR